MSIFQSVTPDWHILPCFCFICVGSGNERIVIKRIVTFRFKEREDEEEEIDKPSERRLQETPAKSIWKYHCAPQEINSGYVSWEAKQVAHTKRPHQNKNKNKNKTKIENENNTIRESEIPARWRSAFVAESIDENDRHNNNNNNRNNNKHNYAKLCEKKAIHLCVYRNQVFTEARVGFYICFAMSILLSVCGSANH